MSRRLTLLGAVVASTALTTRVSASTEPREPARPRTRYEDAIAEVLARKRAALTFPPSWETALAAWREEAGMTAQNRPALRFDIPAGPLRDVIATFERLTQLHVSFAQVALGDIQSPGVSRRLYT